RLASANRSPAMIIGEAGTGKRWLAHTIHSQGVTAELPFLTVDCAALPTFALELLLFGECGLGGSAQLGTVYLRDPAALARDLQFRLVAWLSTAAGDRPRIIAGCRQEPAEDVAAERLLEELHEALAVQNIRLLP